MGALPTGTVTFLFTDIEGSTELVARLRERRGEVMTALGGGKLRVQVIVTGERTHAYRVVFTSDGNVALLGPENLGGEEFRPQFVLAGTAADVVAVLVGTETVQSAEARGLLVSYADPIAFEPLRALVAAELSGLLDEIS